MIATGMFNYFKILAFFAIVTLLGNLQFKNKLKACRGQIDKSEIKLDRGYLDHY